jgi:hypothetical protein
VNRGRGRVRQRLHHVLLDELQDTSPIDWSRAIVDSSHVRAKGGEQTGPSLVDRSCPGSKHHLIVDGKGIPLTGANRHDVTPLTEPVEPSP